MATAATTASRLPRWLAALGPLVVIAGLIVAFLVLDPIGRLNSPPPAEAVAIERTVLRPGQIELKLRNDAPDEIRIAQVLVNDAYRNFEITRSNLGRLETTTLRIPYPWDAGLPLHISLITSTGFRIDHEIEAAVETPVRDTRTLGIYALLGIYIGLIPVLVGLLWFSSLKRASARWIAFFLALTVGLLVFLLVDTVAEGLEMAAETAAALDGVALFAIGALTAIMALLLVERWIASRKAIGGGLLLAYFIAAGIGLHNLGEGLAVGAALAAGEVALGTFLILGFAVHNTTEGLAIVAPLGRERSSPSLWHFAALGALAGIPTVFGAWAGGFAFSAAWGSFAFGVAAGAIAQVVWAIANGMRAEGGLTSGHGTAGFLIGLIVMYLTGLFTA